LEKIKYFRFLRSVLEIAKFYDIGTLNLVIQQIFKGNLTFFTLRAFETAKGQIWIRIFFGPGNPAVQT